MYRAQKRRFWVVPAALVFFLGPVAALPAMAQEAKRITILYDAFGAHVGALEMDWGFSALVEYRESGSCSTPETMDRFFPAM